MTTTQVLAIVNPFTSLANLSAAEVERVFRCGINAVDFRWPLRGHTDWQRQRGAVLDYATRARDLGLEVRLHFWAGSRAADGGSAATPELGRRQGKEMAEACAEARAAVCGLNAERDVWRGRQAGGVTYVHEDAIPYQDEFWSELYTGNREVRGQYVGFVHPAAYYRNVLFPDWLKARSPLLGAMAYQSSYAALTKTLARARENWPEHRLAGWFGVGRKDSRGVTVGHAGAIRRLCAERAFGLAEVVHYVGNDGAWKMLLEGRPDYPPITAMVADMIGTERNGGVA